MGKKTDYAALRAGFGLVRGLSDEFIQACERVNPPIKAIRRLVTPQGRDTMNELVRRAVADWQAEQPVEPEVGQPQGAHPYRGGNDNGLPANHYRVRVNRGPLPPMATLEECTPRTASRLSTTGATRGRRTARGRARTT